MARKNPLMQNSGFLKSGKGREDGITFSKKRKKKKTLRANFQMSFPFESFLVHSFSLFSRYFFFFHFHLDVSYTFGNYLILNFEKIVQQKKKKEREGERGRERANQVKLQKKKSQESVERQTRFVYGKNKKYHMKTWERGKKKEREREGER